MLKNRKKLLEDEFSPEDSYAIDRHSIHLTYLHHDAVIQRLNQVYGNGHWSFYVQDYQFHGSEVVVKGTLRVPGAGYSQFGCHRIEKTRITVGETIKSAASNCLMRCALMLGIGLYLRQRSSLTQHRNSDTMTTKQAGYLKTLVAQQKLTQEEINRTCQELYSSDQDKLTKEQASQLISTLMRNDKKTMAA